jgi:hypothetical protein
MNINDFYEGWVNKGAMNHFDILKLLDSLDDGREGTWCVTIRKKHDDEIFIESVVWFTKADLLEDLTFDQIHKKTIDAEGERCILIQGDPKEDYSPEELEDCDQIRFELHPDKGYVTRTPRGDGYNLCYYDLPENHYDAVDRHYKVYYTYRGWNRCTNLQV